MALRSRGRITARLRARRSSLGLRSPMGRNVGNYTQLPTFRTNSLPPALPLPRRQHDESWDALGRQSCHAGLYVQSEPRSRNVSQAEGRGFESLIPLQQAMTSLEVDL